MFILTYIDMTEEYKSEQDAYDQYVAAAIQGLTSNAGRNQLAHTELAAEAVEIAEHAIDERRMNAWHRDRFYEEVPDGRVPPDAMADAVS